MYLNCSVCLFLRHLLQLLIWQYAIVTPFPNTTPQQPFVPVSWGVSPGSWAERTGQFCLPRLWHLACLPPGATRVFLQKTQAQPLTTRDIGPYETFFRPTLTQEKVSFSFFFQMYFVFYKLVSLIVTRHIHVVQKVNKGEIWPLNQLSGQRLHWKINL